MKKISIIVLLILASIKIIAQDIVVNNDKSETQSKVVEITDQPVKYKKYEMADGPLNNINKSDVFIMVDSNSSKEYFGKRPVSVVAYPNPNYSYSPSQKLYAIKPKQDSIDPKKMDNWINSIATDDKFTTLDMEFNKKLYQTFYIGLDYYNTFSTLFSSNTTGGVYVNLALKCPLDKAKKFYLWANGGYNLSLTGSYTVGNQVIPASSTGGFLWEIGADYYFSKETGITVYSTQANGLWIGFVTRSAKLF